MSDYSNPAEISRRERGKRAYIAGHGAETQVEAYYARLGFRPLVRCWRGTRGELDLVLSGPDCLVFVEVKHSRTHDRALGNLSWAQFNRIAVTAEEFRLSDPRYCNLDMRFDLATVDGQGRIEVLENLTLW